MSPNLADFYSDYIACLNAQDWENLGHFVHPDVVHNARPLGLHGYRSMLEADYRAIPDLRFAISFLVVDPPKLAARLVFNCTPAGEFLGLAVNGAPISFAENVFYAFEDGRIREVWSVIDKGAIEAQLRSA
ncbi:MULTISPECIES: ester cyclase [unclassified Pseudomonas]|uniref:ester cyclase n=1 Tax=unclassified Pseudomonas TaxID=196821 RepID=UPI00119C237D|nr:MULTISPECIES: ester cyclase [unclassified Pseudomonas]TWC18441.1 putative ester cyclase [Pseudomonas sp. SJZ075]TWC23445.1 putative ester cyclase [Pseudomonas sp. SJZ074]TWC34788.1 putative ester cyclase [Pseudomonas sp. SJZ078]TWC40607.1 putative ester cyclase [Pseudomonas sp. SJZ085]TWC55466.1 putative ester cyclase [Pseudomonas sp. SJZ124]